MKQIQVVGSAAASKAIRFVFISALILAAAGLVRVEAQKSATAPANVAAGAPTGSYSLTDFESVNLYSGNLNFNLPLVATGGRGGVRVPFSLSVNNNTHWDLSRPNTVLNTNIQSNFTYTVDITDKSHVTIWAGIESNGTFIPLYKANEYTSETRAHTDIGFMNVPPEPQPADRPYHIEAAGFLHPADLPYVLQHPKVGYNPGILLYKTGYQGGHLANIPNQTVLGWSLTRLSFITSDGTEYELRDVRTGGAAHDARTNGNQIYSRGRVFVTADGSSATFISDAEVTERFQFDLDNVRPDRPSGYLMFAGGTRYRIDSGNISWIRDRNGNLTTFTYDASGRVISARDSIGRVVTIAYKGTTDSATGTTYDHDEIGFRGAGGQPRTIKVWRGHLGDALTSGTTKTIHELFPAWELDDSGEEVVNPDDVTSAVELPDGRRYELRYNAYGELARVTLPTGGKIEYDYLLIASPHILQRRVAERRLYANSSDTVPELKQVFSYSINDGSIVHQDIQTVDVEQRAGVDGKLLSFERHYFHGDISVLHKGLYTSWREGKEFKTETFDTDGVNPTSLLRRVEHTLQPRQYVGYFPPASRDSGPAFDPRVVETVTTLENGLVARQSAIDPLSPDPQNPNVGFDRFNNLTDSWEYDFHLPGEPESLLRHTQTAYMDGAAYTGGAWDVGSSPDAAAIQNILDSTHLRGLPARKSVFDAGGAERARTTFEYDNYTHDPGTNNRHAALVSYSDIFGLCLALDTAGNCTKVSDASYTTRGNITGTTNYLLDKDGNVNGSVSSNQQYDIAGNVVKSVDARPRPDDGGYETAFNFSDNFGSPDTEASNNTVPSELGSLKSYALLKSVTNALGQTSYTQYDYYTGQAVNTEDINGTVSSVRYEDPLDRPTKAERAVNVPALRAQTAFHYDDAAHTITTTSDQKSYGDNLLKGEVIYDGLGRTTESRRYETPAQYVSTLTRYDALGRASEVSNPFRPGPQVEPVWTKTSYDALGRAWMVTTPDGAKGITHFDGVRTLVTDQARKQRISRTDALGRLVEVWEVRSVDAATGTEAVSFPHYADVPDVTAGYRTAYKYDMMGNLRKVEQGTQSRFFAYDSLGRLIRVSNPEQDANASLVLPAGMLNSPVDANNSWTLAYEYDEVGSLKKRTDARGVETSYAYDALGRVTDMSYTDVHLPQGGTITTPPVKYYYDAQPLPEGAPTFDRGKSLGRLVAVTYGGASLTTGSYTGGYDELGRARYSAQVTLQPGSTGQPSARTYAFGYEYTLDGSLKSETYPSGRVVASEYDSAGRLAGVKNQGGGYYAGGDPSVVNNPNVISYAPHGGVSALNLGNGLWEHTLYNERLQPYEIGLGTSGTDSSKLKLEYSYVPTVNVTADPTRNNGNVQSQRVSVPAEGVTPAQTFTQSYTYDALNRLESASEVNRTSETWRQTYTYDRYGNRRLDEPHTTKLNASGATVYAVDSSNRPTMNPAIGASTNRITEASYTFDASGNLLCDPQHQCVSSQTFTTYFDYDAAGRMVRAAGEVQAGGSDYAYDGEGQRVKKVSGSLVTVFIYDAGGRLVAEYSNRVVVGETSYLTQDTLGSTRVVTGQGGNVQSRHDYLPFGEEINSIAVPDTGRESSQSYNYGTVRQKFTGYEHDDETELDFAKARYYVTKQGRFTAVDPLMASADSINPQTWNRYAYVSNNPLIMIDPTGERGDYYNRSGEWVFSDGKNDDKVYIISGTTQAPYTELSVTHTQFKIISNIIRQEGGTDDANEYLWLAHASDNEAVATNRSLYNLLRSGFSSVPDKSALATTDDSVRANAARAGVMDVLTGGPDPTGGARRWDGTDFLAWGLRSPDGGPHNKFNEYGTIAISQAVFDAFVSSQNATSVRYGKTRYSIPAEVFDREKSPKNWSGWTVNGSPVSGFLYIQNRGSILYATGTAGKSIFWAVHYTWDNPTR
jgi:RHS repeat-associated protein